MTPLKIEVTEAMRIAANCGYDAFASGGSDAAVLAALTAAFQHPEFVAQLDRWLPIESAPKDGMVVMFHVPGQKRPQVCRGDDFWYGRPDPNGRGFAHWLDGATHWRHLPEPPRASLGRLLGEEG